MAASTDTSPIWLSHHWPDHYDRCVRVGHAHVCRRCAVLYPLIVLSAVLALVLDAPQSALWAAWLLPLPLAIEWTGEHLGRLRYSATRQIGTTALAAPGFGIALSVHIEAPFALAALAPVAVYVLVLFVVAVATHGVDGERGDGVASDWETALQRDEDERLSELHRLLEAADASMRDDPAGVDIDGPR